MLLHVLQYFVIIACCISVSLLFGPYVLQYSIAILVVDTYTQNWLNWLTSSICSSSSSSSSSSSIVVVVEFIQLCGRKTK